MDTQVKTPQAVFLMPQRLVVPLFQRPYVWSEEKQWEPLWSDVSRVAGRYLDNPHQRHQPHFLGAVVLQQLPGDVSALPQRVIIDGQQRLTTLQLMLDAIHAELAALGQAQAADRLEALVVNPAAFYSKPEDRYKVWPTNRDRPAFNEVMSASPPVSYEALTHRTSRMAEAHRFFGERVKDWLSVDGDDGVAPRAQALDISVRELLQMVVIDLAMDENAQEIFETLNARGAPLTAADLVKNFVFQRLLEEGVDVEDYYKRYWEEFETGFWEAEISAGRLLYSRSSLFINHWLTARTGTEVVAREVFARFKTYATFEAGVPMSELVQHIHRAAGIYRKVIEDAASQSGPLDRVGLFAYRTSTLESEIVKPVLLFLLDPEKERVPAEQIDKALRALESWLVRRMLVRATTKAYNQLIPELIAEVSKLDRSVLGDAIEDFLREQTVDSRYWPDDADVTREVSTLLAYRRLRRGRLRMVLEAIEDHLRGFDGDMRGLTSERVPRGRMVIEHTMPVKWATHWPLEGGPAAERDRDLLVHTIGNLTLLTERLNIKVSNGPWDGETGKRSALSKHDVLLMNRQLCHSGEGGWDDDRIRERTTQLTRAILEVWPVPAGHVSMVTTPGLVSLRHEVELVDLIEAGVIEPGLVLHARGKGEGPRTAIVLPDGRLDVDGKIYDTPSGAATAIDGRHRNGWWFLLVDVPTKRSLRRVRRDYIESLDGDTSLDDDEDED